MPKATKSRFEASLDEDIAAAGITQEQLDAYDNPNLNSSITGEENDESTGTQDDETQPDSKAASERIKARRSKRAASNDDGASQDDGDTSRGSDGTAPRDGDTSSQDGERLQEDGGLEEPENETAWARHRREMRDLKGELNRLKNPAPAAKEPAAATPPATTTQAEPAASAKVEEKVNQRTMAELGAEPDREEDLGGWLVWNQERANIKMQEIETENKNIRNFNLVQRASTEMDQSEREYKTQRPDFDKAIDHAAKAYTKAVRTLMPNKTDAEIALAIRQEKFGIAMQCAADGTSYPEALYDLAIERFGYDPDAQGNDDSGEDYDDPKPALRPLAKPAPVAKASASTVAKNQRRSASPLEGGGQRGTPRITLEQAASMTPGELMSLPQEDIAYLESIGF